MASRERVLRYLRAGDGEENQKDAFQNLITTQMMNGWTTPDDQEFQLKLTDLFVQRHNEYELSFYMQRYTDDEVDQLIALQNHPVKIKERELDLQLKLGLSDILGDTYAEMLRR